MGLLVAATVGSSLSPLVPAIYLVASVAAFFCYRVDKLAAVSGHRRMPENTLLGVGLLCGWPGALVAQHMLRHKTSKASFQVAFWTTVFMNTAGLLWVWSRNV